MNRPPVKLRRVLPILAALALTGCATAGQLAPIAQPVVEARIKPILAIDGLRFRDLNADGRLDPYENWRLSDRARTEDLAARMTVAKSTSPAC